MTRRERDLKRRLLVLAEPIGAKVEIGHTGASHLRVTFKRGARCVVFYFAMTPSDFRNEKNEMACVRRRLRSIVGRAA
jgi:hypothetical protein